MHALLCDDSRVPAGAASSSSIAAMEPSRWRRPAAPIIKLNFDASWTTTTGAGLSMIARNSNGEVMAAAAHGPVGAPSPVVAEAMAFSVVRFFS